VAAACRWRRAAGGSSEQSSSCCDRLGPVTRTRRSASPCVRRAADHGGCRCGGGEAYPPAVSRPSARSRSAPVGIGEIEHEAELDVPRSTWLTSTVPGASTGRFGSAKVARIGVLIGCTSLGTRFSAGATSIRRRRTVPSSSNRPPPGRARDLVEHPLRSVDDGCPLSLPLLYQLQAVHCERGKAPSVWSIR
jgi:hypothetical protein